MCEIRASEVSCPTDMSPTATFTPGTRGVPVASAECGWGGVYPGYGGTGVGREGYTGYYPGTLPGTHIQYI